MLHHTGTEALFENATEGILVSDEQGRVVDANPAACRLFGYSAEEFVALHISDLIPRRYAFNHGHQHAQYMKAPSPRTMGSGRDLHALRKDGSEFPVEISLSPFRSGDAVLVMAFIIDITQRKEAEDKLKNYSIELEQEVENRTLILSEAIQELEQTKADLHDALIKEKELNDLKSRFVSMVSHEFRTPLATILSSLALVRKYGEINDAAKQDKHLDRIRTAVNNLTDMLNDVLSLSKLEEGRVLVTPEPVSIPAFVTEQVQDLQPVAPAGQEISYTHEGSDEPVLTDRKILRHILFNLLSNALKFSPEKTPVELYTRLSENRLEITVRDHGIGIAEEDQRHLFERFFRAQNAVNIQGTGLGLNIVSRYVELLQGTITLRSQLGQGTEFILHLPIPAPND